jgi:polynucleotide 5'-kinase involved in rRNA processing
LSYNELNLKERGRRFAHLEDADGFMIGLGIVEEVSREGWEVILQTPLTSIKGVVAIRLGDMAIDLPNFSDGQLPLRGYGHGR